MIQHNHTKLAANSRNGVLPLPPPRTRSTLRRDIQKALAPQGNKDTTSARRVDPSKLHAPVLWLPR